VRRNKTILGVVAAIAAGGAHVIAQHGPASAHAAHEGHAALQALDLVGFFTLGLIGGVAHCVGMCTPFVLFVSRRFAGSNAARLVYAPQLWYTAGRLVTYAALGALAGGFGRLVAAAEAVFGVQRAAAAVAGTVLVVWGVAALLNVGPKVQGCGGWLARVTGTINRRIPGHPVTLGLMLGLLPCGLLYSAVVAAAARGGPAEGAIALAVFGLGTTPALFGVSLADEVIFRQRRLLNRVSQAFVLVMGVWFLWRGLAL
jgi:hypothetical protein